MSELRALKIKTYIMRLLCTAQNSVEQQCVLDYICAHTQKYPQQKIKQSKLKDLFSDAPNIIGGLRGSHFIIMNDGDITLNEDMFKILPLIIKDVEKELTEEQKKIQSNQQKITCAVCSHEREAYYHQFLACPCGNTKIKQKDDKKQNMKLKKCKIYLKIYGRVKELLIDLEHTLTQIKNENCLIKEKQEAGKKVSTYDQYIHKLYEKLQNSKYKVKDLKNVIKYEEEPKFNTKFLIKTNQKYQPRLEYPQLRERSKPRSRSHSYDRQFMMLRQKNKQGLLFEDESQHKKKTLQRKAELQQSKPQEMKESKVRKIHLI